MGMLQTYRAGLIDKVFEVLAASKLSLQDLDRYKSMRVEMFRQVNDTKGSSTQAAKESILSKDFVKLSALLICHISLFGAECSV